MVNHLHEPASTSSHIPHVLGLDNSSAALMIDMYVSAPHNVE